MTPSTQLEVDSPFGRRSVSVPAYSPHSLTELLRQIELPLNTRCGNRGRCDGCLVELVEGGLVESASGASTSTEAQPRRLRACQYDLPPDGRTRIRVPARSLLAHQPQIVTSFRILVPYAHDPLWQEVAIDRDELSPVLPWLESICHAVAQQHALKSPLIADASLAASERDDGPELRFAIQHEGNHWSLRPAPPKLSQHTFGAAIDIGTTTVVVLLVDLATGEIVAEASALNAQTDLGDNVLTRINLCMTDQQMVGRLQQAVTRSTLSSLLDEALRQAVVSADQLLCMAVAGNSTMLHLLSGVDPSGMGLAPFTPSFLEHRVISAHQLPWQTASIPRQRSPTSGQAIEDAATCGYAPGSGNPPIHLLPGAAAYLGADVVAGIVSTGIAYSTETCMLVDVGTNGEIVLKHGDQLLACATAAGPAFEGLGLTCGLRAGKGAISHVWFGQDPPRLEFDVIGGGTAVGICGTAYVDVIAQARKVGLIGPTGRFVEHASDAWPVERLRHGWGLAVTESRGGESIHVTEADIASLLQAKAAIAAGILCLLDRVDLRSEDVTTLLLAGGFGFHMNVEHAIDLGLLPGFRPSQVRLVGNSSLAGAYLALLDSGALDELSRVAATIETVELNLEPQFESRFIDQLSLEEHE